MRKLTAALWIILSATALHAQVVPIPPQQCVWHAGDNPAWANPSFDDSAWQPYSTWDHDIHQPRIWIRCHPGFAALRGTPHPAVQIRLAAAYQLYLNGILIGGAGNLSSGHLNWNQIRTWPLPSPLLQPQPATLALRVTYLLYNMVPLGTPLPLRIDAGDQQQLIDHRAAVILEGTSRRLANFLCFGIIGVIGLMTLGIYFYDRERRELLLLSLMCIALADLRVNEFCIAAMLPLPMEATFWFMAIGNTLIVSDIVFFFTLARRRIPKIYWVLIAVAVSMSVERVIGSTLPPGPSLVYGAFMMRFIYPVTLTAYLLYYTFPFFLFLPLSRVPRRMRALAWLGLAYGAINVIWMGVQETAVPLFGLPNLFVRWSIWILDVRAFAIAAILLTMLALLFRDQRRVADERALLAGEMLAARDVQQHLVPATLPPVAGFHLESAYLPAADVGGDFYHVLPQPGGATLIVIGDVSGKGLRAAMTGTMVLGAVRALAQDILSPSQILIRLNAQLAGSPDGGFVTCLILSIAPSGSITCANAGHIPPYRNGEEMSIDSGLPLGLTADSPYGESAQQLAPGDTLTLLSDGVVEARSDAGEIYGFDRTRQISTQSAEEIARAAQAHGQEDDITVLTLQYAPAEVLHA